VKKQIAMLQKQIADLQAFCGVLTPVFEKEYKEAKWSWEGKKAKKREDKRPCQKS
jgi:hypothetical protein